MADNTPNFDAMTPEEIMAWMESLAKRQGADSSGFTTAANVDIPEIDPDSVVIDEPGYVPSEGKDRGKRIGPGVSVNKPAATTSTPQPAPTAKPAPVTQPPPAPVAKPVVAAPPPPPQATPVAKSAPITSSPAPVTKPPAPPAQPAAQMSIFDEPAQIEAPDWLANLGMGNELPPEPIEDAPETAAPSLSWLESLAVDSNNSLPDFDLSALGSELTPASSASAPIETNPVNWLESLAQNSLDVAPPQPAASNPVNWLENLAQEQGVKPATPAAVPADDPVNWLESLAKRQGARSEELTTGADLEVPETSKTEAAASAGYSEYAFESPVPPAKSEPPKQTSPFAAEQPTDPAAWLDSLASQAFEATKQPAAATPPSTDSMSDTDIQQALKRGELVPPDQMEAWMQRQLREGASRPEPEELEGDYDPDAPPVKADLPDWLIEQVGDSMPLEEPAAPAAPVAQTPALIETILEPPTVTDIPDWLKDDEPASDELDSIFATPAPENWSDTSGFTEPAATPAAPTAEPVIAASALIDPSDPWVEALEMEYIQTHGDQKGVVTPPPQQPAAAAPVAPTPVPEPVPQASAPVATLPAASLPPEKDVPVGQPDAVPAWLASVTDEQPVDVIETVPVVAPSSEAVPDWLTQEIIEPESGSGDLPDWLGGVNVDSADIPDWLKQSITTTHEEAIISPVPPPAPTPVVTAPIVAAQPTPTIVPVRAASPAPVPAAAQDIDVAATLTSARTHAGENNLDASLPHYEMLVRANAVLDDVVNDLTALAGKFKTSPAVHRVLGDTLMRQGKLQAALDTYRKALNQL